MKITVSSGQAGHWFDLVARAMVGLDQDRGSLEEGTRQRVISRENRFRRWVPFWRPLPSDTPLRDVTKYMSTFDDYWFDLCLYEDREQTLLRIFRAMDKLICGDVDCVTLNDNEVQLIRRYADEADLDAQ